MSACVLVRIGQIWAVCNIGSVSQILESELNDIYCYEASRACTILVKPNRPLFSRAANRRIKVRIFGGDKLRSSPTQVDPVNHATRPDCVVVKV